MSNLSVTEGSRRVLSSVLWIAVAFLGLSAGTASAQNRQIDICHKGQTISVDVHAVPAHLEQHGDTIGPCGEPGLCPCPGIFFPVTCADGRTYANQCFADCAEAPGPCGPVGVCSNIYDPVRCGGVVYANECQARVAGCTGDNERLCPCSTDVAPVRCSDGIIYINACVALCQGASGCTPLQ